MGVMEELNARTVGNLAGDEKIQLQLRRLKGGVRPFRVQG